MTLTGPWSGMEYIYKSPYWYGPSPLPPSLWCSDRKLPDPFVGEYQIDTGKMTKITTHQLPEYSTISKLNLKIDERLRGTSCLAMTKWMLNASAIMWLSSPALSDISWKRHGETGSEESSTWQGWLFQSEQELSFDLPAWSMLQYQIGPGGSPASIREEPGG